MESPVTRTCGSCRVCCIVPELFLKDGTGEDKPNYVPCHHLAKVGCSIYKDRPKGCRDYTCLWLAGFGRYQDRPDKSRVLAESIVLDEGVVGVQLIETCSDGFKQYGKKFIKNMVKLISHDPVYQVKYKSKTMVLLNAT